jgi:hypothetical protein
MQTKLCFLKIVMSREEANRLSSLRREELRKNKELENNRALRIKNMLKVSRFDFIFKELSAWNLSFELFFLNFHSIRMIQ